MAGQTSAETRITANAKGYSSWLFMGTCLSSYSFGSRAHAGDAALKIASEDAGPSSSTYEIVWAGRLGEYIRFVRARTIDRVGSS